MAGKPNAAHAAILALITPLLGSAAPPPTSPVTPPAVIQIGTAYIAKQYCSCVLVTGRSEGACHAEFKPEIAPFTVAIDRRGLPKRATVTARVGSVEALASYSAKYGCSIRR